MNAKTINECALISHALLHSARKTTMGRVPWALQWAVVQSAKIAPSYFVMESLIPDPKLMTRTTMIVNAIGSQRKETNRILVDPFFLQSCSFMWRVIVSIFLLVAILFAAITLIVQRTFPQTEEQILRSKIHALDGMIEEKASGVSVTLTGDLNISDPDITEIAKLKELHTLRLYNTNVTGNGIKSLASNRTLRELHLDGSKLITDDSMSAFLLLRELRFLSLRNTQISQETIDKLRKQMKNCKIKT